MVIKERAELAAPTSRLQSPNVHCTTAHRAPAAARDSANSSGLRDKFCWLGAAKIRQLRGGICQSLVELRHGCFASRVSTGEVKPTNCGSRERRC